MTNDCNEDSASEITPDSAMAEVRKISGQKHNKIGLRKFLPPKQTALKILVLFVGYFLSYLQSSFLIIAIATIIWFENRENQTVHRIKARSNACSMDKKELKVKLEEIPAWVKFPDRERAEWLNQVIAQFWPTVQNYVVKLFRGSIQNKIRKKYPSFTFEDIDLGCNTPKIDGVKVYNCGATKDSIIIDFDLFYDGNCDIDFSVSGAPMGGMKDFQFSVEMRVVLKPLLLKMPLIGGIQIFFLNTPDLSFTLEGLSGIPGLSYFIRKQIEQRFMKLIVYPNKFTKRFTKNVEAAELKTLEPAGVLRVHVSEAKELMAKDITGKSDPYVIISVGAQQYQTHYVGQTLSPKWDFWCEFIIQDPLAQHVSFKLYDHDKVNEDDFLGSGEVDIGEILRGNTDQWIQLDNADKGKIHLRFTWLSSTSDINALESALQEMQLLKAENNHTALLMVYVDTAQSLPMTKSSVRPNPYFVLAVGQQTVKSKIKKHTTDPVWEQGFALLVADPRSEHLLLTIKDKKSDTVISQFAYMLKNLLKTQNLEISKGEFDLSNGVSKIVISMQLRILIKDNVFDLEEEESASDSDVDELVKAAIDPLKDSNRSSSLQSSTSSKMKYLHKEICEEEVKKTVSRTDSSSPRTRSPFTRSQSNISSSGDQDLGKIELTLSYSEPRQKFLITVHRITNLPIKEDSSDIPDPYVKIELFPHRLDASSGASIKHKTSVKTDSINPVYEETFEDHMSKSDVYDHTLIVTVKTKKFFNNPTIGKVELNMTYVDLSKPYHNWFDLVPK